MVYLTDAYAPHAASSWLYINIHTHAYKGYARYGTWWGNIVLPHLTRWRSELAAGKHWSVKENAGFFHISKGSNEWSKTSAMTPYNRQIIICCLKWNIKTWKKCTGWGNTAFCSEYDGVSFTEGCGNIAATDRLADACCSSIVLLSSATKDLFHFHIASHWLSIYEGSHNHLVQQRSYSLYHLVCTFWPVQWNQ